MVLSFRGHVLPDAELEELDLAADAEHAQALGLDGLHQRIALAIGQDEADLLGLIGQLEEMRRMRAPPAPTLSVSMRRVCRVTPCALARRTTASSTDSPRQRRERGAMNVNS
ncbi:hypothetical protein [Comamonas faecalis]|uniref:hypothetical protein n=1 Tax=Comamonas faecalis TaxID=1387849 RepID=UPI0031F113D5